MTDDAETEDEEEILVPEDTYLTAGVHIGTQQKSKDMERFIHKVRNDGLFVLDIDQTDGKVRSLAKLLSRYPPERVLLVSARQYGKRPIEKFSDIMGTASIAGRFIPGTLTNPSLDHFIEPEVIVVIDPSADRQAVKEAVNAGLPIVGLVDTNNSLKNVDIAVPSNNKGRKALALVFWLLAREMKLFQGEIDNRDEFDYEVDDFEQTL
ncbi:MAG: 30S ribosomal protein S2 [Candidatus Thermoplasmatota archaeon]|nr:30S ribosomal protein S2 [Candidatus Thermoplasmatota archaeon]